MALAFRISPDLEWIAASVANEKFYGVKIWSAATGAVVSTVDAQASALAFNGDARKLAIGTLTIAKPVVFTSRVKVVDVPTGRELIAFPPVAGQFTGLTFSPRGERLATVSLKAEFSAPGSATPIPKLIGVTKAIWDVRQARLLSTVDPGPSGGDVQFSPDGERVVSSRTQPIRQAVLSLASGTTVRVVKVLPDASMPFVFSPDGRALATSTPNRSVTIWDARTGNRLVSLPAHNSTVRSLAFSPDGSRLVSLTDARTVTLWDVRTGHQVLTLRETSGPYEAREFTANGTLGPTVASQSVAFTNDGRRIVVTTVAPQGRTIQALIKTWDAAPRPVP